MKPLSLFFVLFVGLTFFTPQAQGYFSTIDTGDLLAPGKYRVIAEPQIIFSRYDGANLIGRFDTGLNEEGNVRVLLGTGRVDFQVGALYKWIPFPDLDKQPALGGSAGFVYARVQGETELSLRVHPLISKKFLTEIGDFTPYASLPLGVTTRGSDTFTPIQLVVGSEWQTLNWKNLTFFAEIGLNVNRSFGYLSGAVAYYFDEDRLKGKKK